MTDAEMTELQASLARVLGADRYARAVAIVAMVRSLVDGVPAEMAITLVEAIGVFATAQRDMAGAIEAARTHLAVIADMAPPRNTENFS